MEDPLRSSLRNGLIALRPITITRRDCHLPMAMPKSKSGTTQSFLTYRLPRLGRAGMSRPNPLRLPMPHGSSIGPPRSLQARGSRGRSIGEKVQKTFSTPGIRFFFGVCQRHSGQSRLRRRMSAARLSDGRFMGRMFTAKHPQVLPKVEQKLLFKVYPAVQWQSEL